MSAGALATANAVIYSPSEISIHRQTQQAPRLRLVDGARSWPLLDVPVTSPTGRTHGVGTLRTTDGGCGGSGF